MRPDPTVSLQGCASGPTIRTIEWKEEVALSNGKIVIVERMEDFMRVGEPGRGSGWLFDRGTIRASLDTPRSIFWEGSLSPLAIDQVGDRTYFVGVATRRAELEMPIRDGAFHVAMVRGGDETWRRIPLADLPPQVEPNLLQLKHDVFFKGGYRPGQIVAIEQKRKVETPDRLDYRYRVIPRVDNAP